jgi:hypothetical protein
LVLLILCVLSIFKSQQIRREFQPFLIVCWIGLFNQLTGIPLMYYFRLHNYIPSNIYNLVEGLLYLWFFRRINVLHSRFIHRVLIGILMLAFVVDAIWFHPIHTTYMSYYTLVNFSILIYLSINGINQVLITERDILRNSFFLISLGLLIFSTYFLILEIFWVYGALHNIQFGGAVFGLLKWVNLACNLIFLMAVVWMQKRKIFTLQF